MKTTTTKYETRAHGVEFTLAVTEENDEAPDAVMCYVTVTDEADPDTWEFAKYMLATLKAMARAGGHPCTSCQHSTEVTVPAFAAQSIMELGYCATMHETFDDYDDILGELEELDRHAQVHVLWTTTTRKEKEDDK